MGAGAAGPEDTVGNDGAGGAEVVGVSRGDPSGSLRDESVGSNTGVGQGGVYAKGVMVAAAVAGSFGAALMTDSGVRPGILGTGSVFGTTGCDDALASDGSGTKSTRNQRSCLICSMVRCVEGVGLRIFWMRGAEEERGERGERRNRTEGGGQTAGSHREVGGKLVRGRFNLVEELDAGVFFEGEIYGRVERRPGRQKEDAMDGLEGARNEREKQPASMT
jgi:hypothetical protein